MSTSGLGEDVDEASKLLLKSATSSLGFGGAYLGSTSSRVVLQLWCTHMGLLRKSLVYRVSTLVIPKPLNPKLLNPKPQTQTHFRRLGGSGPRVPQGKIGPGVV